LAVTQGETVGVVGPSGSGKSTMMMVIAGLERPTGGVVQVAGERLDRMDEDALATFRRENVGIVFQSFHLIPTMTALENVAVPMELARRADAFLEAKRLLELVGLSHRFSHYPGQLSGGEQQRVALARAFAGRPRLLLADEPTGNLDRANGQAVIDLMFDLHAEIGTTLLLITHDPALAARCGRRVTMADGRILNDAAAPEMAG
jgi:putative ABC transport system ATP-binding protein